MKLTPPNALIFDIDDTLVDTAPSYRGAIIQTALKFGGTVTMQDIADAKARGDANNDWILTRDLLKMQQIDVSLDAVVTVFEELYQGANGVDGLKKLETLLIQIDTLHQLSHRFKLGIVTGRPRADAEDFLQLHQIRHLFETVITMDDGPLKPSPEPVQMALTQLHEKNAWMIGDTPDDIHSAVRAGIVGIGVIAPSDEPIAARNALMAAGALTVLPHIRDLEDLLTP